MNSFKDIENLLIQIEDDDVFEIDAEKIYSFIKELRALIEIVLLYDNEIATLKSEIEKLKKIIN